jgi:acetoin:2,6-dichlorophenolindophenol oxidoreductase subunit beta
MVLNLTYAQAASLALEHAMQQDPMVVALGEDIGRGGIFGQYRGLQERFGAQRVIDTPISEATILGASVGMALAGLKPVVEMRVMDFALCAMDEIINQAAKNRYMFGGQGRVPAVMRMPIGIWSSSAAQHSQSLESWFIHVPGLVVVAPATAQANYSLLRAAIQCGDPVVYVEHKELWGVSGEVDTEVTVELGTAGLVEAGLAPRLTIVSWSRAVGWCVQAAQTLKAQGIGVDVLDLQTLWPWDKAAVLASLRRTGHLLVVHEAVQVAGFGAEIVASMVEAMQSELSGPRDLKVKRLGAPRVPVGYAPNLEQLARITPQQIVDAAQVLVAL